MEPGISSELKPPGRPRKHSLAGHTGIVWGEKATKKRRLVAEIESAVETS